MTRTISLGRGARAHNFPKLPPRILAPNWRRPIPTKESVSEGRIVLYCGVQNGAKGPFMLQLSAIRRNRGISLEQISETTKISVRFLTAVENCDFARLPGGIYNTS